MSSNNLSIRHLCSELDSKAKDELNETPEKLEDGIRHLKEWITSQPHLNARTEDQWLAAYLRGCKHNIERAKAKIELYYSMRDASPELFSFTPNNPRFKDFLKTGTILVLPKLAKSVDPRVILVRLKHYDVKRWTVEEFFSCYLVLQMIMYYTDDSFVVNGLVTVTDVEGSYLSQLIRLTPSLLKKIVIIFQDSCPLRLKGVHNIINCLPFFEAIFSLLKMLLNKKNRKRAYVHSKKGEGLYKHVPKEILPVEYGGNGGTVQEIIDEWIQKIDEYGPWVEADRKPSRNESTCLDKEKSEDLPNDIEISFRKLELD